VIYLIKYGRSSSSRMNLKQAVVGHMMSVCGSDGLPPVTATHAPSVGVAVLVVTVGTAVAVGHATVGHTTPVVVTVHDEGCI